MRIKLTKKEMMAGAATALLFVVAAYVANVYEARLGALIGVQGGAGMAVYVAITAFEVIVAPFSALPLLPVAVALWGSLVTALLSTVGWVIGAVAAFWISRKYGYRIVRRSAALRRIQKRVEDIPEEHLFWSVVFLRIVLPVDILSYGLGLFSKMPFSLYVNATIVGTLPFAFIFSYAAALPVIYQIGALALAGAALALNYARMRTDIEKGSDEG